MAERPLPGLLSPYYSLPRPFKWPSLSKSSSFIKRPWIFPTAFAHSLNRAALSIAANIAEGNGRFTIRDRKTLRHRPRIGFRHACRFLNWRNATRKITVGETVRPKPVQSICLPPRTIHQFWGEEGTGNTVSMEVSSVGDDWNDNFFREPAQRFHSIHEDVSKIYLLCHPYPRRL